MCFRSHPLASSELPVPHKGIWASEPWHTSSLSGPTTPALALPAQICQRSRSLGPMELSLYVHCLASRHCYPETCRGLDFSSLFPAPPQHPFLLLSVLVCSVHALLPPYSSPRSPRHCQLWVWCSLPCLLLAPLSTGEACVWRGAGRSPGLGSQQVPRSHSKSTLWLNSPVSISFLLAQSKCGIMCTAARGECFPGKMKQKSRGGINIRKSLHGSAPTFLFLFFLTVLCAFSKGRPATGS